MGVIESQGQTVAAVRFDLICADGTYYTSVRADAPPSRHRRRAVTHVLPVRGLLRLPFLGLILRNFWAKKNGAVLDPDWRAG